MSRSIVINRCYGGFSLSKRAVARLAELQGRKVYFFRHVFRLLGSDDDRDSWVRTTMSDGRRWRAVDTADLSKVNKILSSPSNWNTMTMEEKTAHNTLYNKHVFETRPDKRDDPLLVQVVKELGRAASGECAKLVIVEIPDDAEWEIEEYNGVEWVAEKHRTWH